MKKNLIKSLGSTCLIPNKKSQKSETPYSYRTINDSVFTLAPTNCNYINHVHWTNTYPLSFVTSVDSHKHLCVLKELYGRQIKEQHIVSQQPIDMRCNTDFLPKHQYQHDLPKSTNTNMDNSYPYVPPVTTSFFPYDYSHNQTHSSQRYGQSSGLHMRRTSMPFAQPVDVSYVRKYMDQKQNSHSSRYVHPYKPHYTSNNNNNNDYWKSSRSYGTTSSQPPFNQSLSFIDIPIHSPTYNIKIPPLRIPITAITPQTHQNLSPSSPTQLPYYNNNYSNKNYQSSSSSMPCYNNYFSNYSGGYATQSSSIMKSLLTMEPKSRFVWS